MRARRNARFRRASLNSMVLSSLFVGCLSILFSSADLARKSARTETASAHPRVELSTGWQYAVDSAHRAPGELPSPPSEGWKAFDAAKSWKLSEELGATPQNIWFKATFETRLGFESPALVLGEIQGAHRVYLNGKMIGKSDETEPLPFYGFDSSLLKFGEPNTLLVSSHYQPLSPVLGHVGMTALPGVGMFIGGFEDVRSSAMRGQTSYWVSQSVLLALALAFSFGVLGYAVFRRAHRSMFYSALVLFSLTLPIACGNPWVATHLQFRSLELLFAAASVLAPVGLCSGILHLRRRYRAENLNNVFAGLALSALSTLVLNAKDAAALQSVVHAALIASACYIGAWASAIALETLENWRSAKGVSHRTSQSPVFETFFGSFACVTGLAILGTLSHSDFNREMMQTWNSSAPFVFGFFMMITSALDRASYTKAVARKNSRNELVSGLIRLIHDSPDVTEAVVAIQDRVSTFLKARRSTLYLMDPTAGTQSLLKATYLHGSDQVRHHIKRSLDPKAGIVGYACQHRAPLLIEDVRSDVRFSKLIDERSDEATSYRTGSCMIFPIVSGSDLLGVLTFADKKGDHPFTHEDFAIALEVTNDLALLLGTQKIQDALTSKLKSS